MVPKLSFATCAALALLIIGTDQVTKWLAVGTFDYGVPMPLCPGLNLTLLHNTGAAFSFLASAGGWQRWFFVALATAASGYLVYLLRLPTPSSASYRLGLAFVLGGALGNLIDRLWLGYVVDFIQVYYRQWYWPAFNVADSAITVGAVLLLLSVFSKERLLAAQDVDRSV
ncbi:MAG: lipoprotein signal peptidase [Gammaproteobacteria bacterium]|nr:lipoprotein signal peptidase [Gammaproteobacteria bacterium]